MSLSKDYLMLTVKKKKAAAIMKISLKGMF